MWQSVIKNIGLAPTEDYIQPRLSIGNTVFDHEFSTGHFSIQVDAQNIALVIKNHHKRVIWKSIHNLPFLSSSLGEDSTILGDNGVFKITEQDNKPTRIQTITKIQRQDDQTIKIYGGLGAKLVLPTHMDYVLTFKEVTHRQLQFSVEITHRDPAMKDYDRLMLIYESRPDEHFYGFGEQFSYTTMKGQKVPILVREQGYGRGAPASSSFKASAMNMLYNEADRFASYASIPQYISSDIRSLFLENSEYMSFDMTEPDRVTIRLESDKMRGRILDGRTMLDILTEYTSYTGRMTPLPDWVSHGLIANISGGKEKVNDIVQRLRAESIPLSAVFIHDWTGQRLQEAAARGLSFTRQHWNWESDDDMYPEWTQFVSELSASQVRVLAYINPLLSDPSMKSRYKNDLFTEASTKGYLVKNALANDSHSQAFSIKFSHDLEAGLLDLTNPDACTWFKQVLKDQVWSTGIAGMMVDFGEHLPCDTRYVALHSGVPASSYHNRYPEEWAQLNKEVMVELGKEDDSLCFYRSAFTHSPGLMNLFWAGDQNVNWDVNHGIKSAVTGMLTGGFSGFSVTHCDAGVSNNEITIAGVKTIRSTELLYRWMELAACTSAFRTSEGLIPSLNAQFYSDEDTYRHLAHTVKLFTLLAEYRKTVLKEAYECGWPVLRHLVFYYPNDKIVRELTYQQFLMGDSVLIAPVLSASTTKVKVYFPKDAEKVTWRHIWSGKYFDGNGSYLSVDAPIGQPAIFIKEPRGDNGLLNSLLDYSATYHQQKINPVSK